MVKASWWLIMTMLLIGLAAIYEYIEGKFKNANILFLIFDIGMLIVFALPIVWLML